ncbi:MAG: hypothetical protein H6713_07615 [Myxococcales bacterium]|nr:hypothetical protein [Myxococcales bacterium]
MTVTTTASRTRARVAIAALLVLALIECVCAARAYRPGATADDWAALAAALDQLPAGEPVLLAQPWLGPRARMEAPRLRGWDSVAPPDLHGARRFHVVGLARARWGPALADDSMDMPDATYAGEERFGGLRLHHYARPQAGATLEDWVGDASTRLEVSDEQGRCRGAGGRWTCKQGALALDTLEIAYRPRRCLAARLDDGARLRVRLQGATLGDELRGHLGFADFNARLRSDAPALLTIAIDGAAAARFVFTDSQGWAGFTLATEPGLHDVELELVTTLSGTWSADRYAGKRDHVPCLELRALDHGAPSEARP